MSERLKKESTLGFIVFLAILLHKAPGAIGFGTFLQHAGLSGNALAKHLLAFTIACPLTSLVTYQLMSSLYASSLQTLDSADDQAILFWVGILLIISAGSFIYVSTMHILPEVLGDHGKGHKHEGHAAAIKEGDDGRLYSKYV